jgi:hypothetical protein
VPRITPDTTVVAPQPIRRALQEIRASVERTPGAGLRADQEDGYEKWAGEPRMEVGGDSPASHRELMQAAPAFR